MRFDRIDCDLCTHKYVCKYREDYETISIDSKKVDEFLKAFLDKMAPNHVLTLDCLDFERKEE